VRAPDGSLTQDCGTGELVTLTRADQHAEIVFAGGAGHGDPRRRDQARVAEDLADGRIGAETARSTYGFADRAAAD